MKIRWILAQAQGQQSEGSEVIAQPEGSPAPQTETGTQVDGTNGTTEGQTDTPQGQQGPNYSMLLILGAVFIFMYFFMIHPQKKQKKRHENMINSLQKNDRVRTIGGILGTIIDIKEDEITLKIDESTNTKMTVLRGSIADNFSISKRQ